MASTSPHNPALAARNLGLKVVRRMMGVHKPVVRVARRAGRLREQAGYRCDEWRVEREIAAIARGNGPIVVGPWLAEVGYEALYWVPFLRWFEDVYRIDPDRVVVLSRGGVDQWYRGLARKYVDLFDFFTPAEFAARNDARRAETEQGGQKQTAIGSFDREILSRLQQHVGYDDAHIFHPGLLFRLLKQFWLGNQSADFLWQHMRFERTQATPPSISLPADYVAVKFYTGTALPDSDATRHALRTMIARVAERQPVVVLDAGVSVDEHKDYLFDGVPNVRALGAALTPRVNLGLQTQVIAGAQRFIGTCGSLAWLAPLLGVPTLAVYADDRLLTPHLMVARQVYRTTSAARFSTVDLRAFEPLHLLA